MKKKEYFQINCGFKFKLYSLMLTRLRFLKKRYFNKSFFFFREIKALLFFFFFFNMYKIPILKLILFYNSKFINFSNMIIFRLFDLRKYYKILISFSNFFFFILKQRIFLKNCYQFNNFFEFSLFNDFSEKYVIIYNNYLFNLEKKKNKVNIEILYKNLAYIYMYKFYVIFNYLFLLKYE